TGGRLSRGLRREGRGLLAAPETQTAGGSPGDRVALGVGNGHHCVVERRADMDLTPLDILPFAAAANDFLSTGCFRSCPVPSPSFLLLVGYGLLGTLAGARVGLAALAADRQALAVPDAAIAADFRQPLDIQGRLTAQIAFDNVIVNRVTELLLI